MIATVLAWPGGRFAVAGVGLVIAAVGLYQLREGWSCGFRDRIGAGHERPAPAVGTPPITQDTAG